MTFALAIDGGSKSPVGKRPIADIGRGWLCSGMRLIQLDASAWTTPDDFYVALLPQLGAPDWHGHNLNALDDSLYGGINKAEPPFRVQIAGGLDLTPDMRTFLDEVMSVFADARVRYGKDVSAELI